MTDRRDQLRQLVRSLDPEQLEDVLTADEAAAWVRRVLERRPDDPTPFGELLAHPERVELLVDVLVESRNGAAETAAHELEVPADRQPAATDEERLSVPSEERRSGSRET